MRVETSPDDVVTVYEEAKVDKRHAYRCPVCGKKCPGYDQGSRSLRRRMVPDMGGILLFIEIGQERIFCADYGVRYPAVPWAYEGSRFTRDFDRTSAWLACQLSRKAVAEYLRIDWETVGRCISRGRKDIEPDLKKRLDGLVHIGINETSYRKGHKYLTIIVDHALALLFYTWQIQTIYRSQESPLTMEDMHYNQTTAIQYRQRSYL